MDQALNYPLAQRLGKLLVRPGPPASPQEASHLVGSLRQAATSALGSVAEITGLDQACEQAAKVPVMVVDRRGFVAANVHLAAALADVVLEGQEMSWFGRSTAGAQLGTVLAVLSARVLGQFDPFYQSQAELGRVLLVAPNVLRFQRALNADPRDFHLWIALHELTHAAQIAAAPWLPDWIRDRLSELVQIDEAEGKLGRLARAARQLPEAMADKSELPPKVFGLFSPAQAYVFQEVTAAMSLLEGHADVIMDAVGPKVVRTVAQLRPRFDARRVAKGRLERAARRLIGLEAKTAQYVQGAEFVRSVLNQVGHEGLNLAFTGPDALPTAHEMDQPEAWVARVVRA